MNEATTMIRENKLYDELDVGDSASITRVCTTNDLYVFAHASGNLNPMHVPVHDGAEEGPAEAVAPSMWVGALVSSVLGNVLPGPGTLYKSQSFDFLERVHVGDELTVSVAVSEKKPDNRVVLDTKVTGRGGDVVAEGVAEVLAPVRKIRIDDEDLPSLMVHRHRQFGHLLEACRALSPLTTAVVAPENARALGGAVLAAQHEIIRPILIGQEDAIAKAAREVDADLTNIEVIDAGSGPEAAATAVELANAGRADAIMKGHLHTDELLHHVVKRDGGLRTARRLSHAFVMDVPGLDQALIISDAAINIAPDLKAKVDITQNAVDLARALGMETPKVGILSAVETVNLEIPSTLDAAALSKMADRGQIHGALVDGPLAMDNAIDMDAAATKGVSSLVAGRADILIVPNLEAGNMLAKQLTFLAHADAAGLVLGAKVPVILTSRADDEKARLASCAIAALYDNWLTSGKPAPRNIAEAAE